MKPLLLALACLVGARQDVATPPSSESSSGAASLADVAAFLEVPPLFSDGMVVQRDSVVPVWGAARPGVRVRVGASWLEGDLAGRADDRGRWRVELPTPPASGPHALVVATDDGAELVVRDVWAGEVWLASGQSNMEWTLGPGVGPGTDAWRYEVAAAELPLVRAFRVERTVAWEPREVAPTDGWVSVTPATAGSRSAVAYYFAERLWRELGVPIGVVECAWGGTPVEAWTSAEAQADEPALAEDLARLARGARDPGAESARVHAALVDWWRSLERADPGGPGRWMAGSTDASGWREVALPGTFADHGEGGFDGVVWYRRTVELPRTWSGEALTLSLGALDDRDTTWFNGVRVGGLEDGGSWATPRRYALPAGLARAGENVVAVRVLDTGGVGGFTSAADELALERASGERTSLAGTWRWRRGTSLYDLAPLPAASWLDEDRPAALFNGMLAPCVGYGLAGFLWYQGESNRLAPVEYATRFPRLIEDWRARWGRGDLPFLFVQIAPHRYAGDRGEASELREAQTCALALANTGMAATTDVGDPDDIHPSNKRAVGERLARLALRRTYGRNDVVDEGPRLAGWQVDGAELRLAFENVDGGLVHAGDAPGPFYLAGEGRRFHPATARVDGTDIVLTCPLVPRPHAARFAWRAHDHGDLANVAGLPAPPFRTDDWPSVTRGGPAFDPR